jgi:hypothetical protein
MRVIKLNSYKLEIINFSKVYEIFLILIYSGDVIKAFRSLLKK